MTLDDLDDRHRIALRVLGASTRPWMGASREVRGPTLASLVRLGLADERLLSPSLRREYRISRAGRALLEVGARPVTVRHDKAAAQKCQRCRDQRHTNPGEESYACECGERTCACYGLQVRAGVRRDKASLPARIESR